MSKVHIARQGYLTKSALPNVSRTGSIPASLLLLGDGTNGSTTFTDSSINNLTVTRVGTTVISTTSPPTGMASSIYFPGNSYLTSAWNASAFTFAADFTIELFINFSSHESYGGIFSAVRNISGDVFAAGIQFIFNSTTNAIFVEYVGGSFITSNTIPANTWTHLALTRTSGVLRMFIGGVQGGSASLSGTIASGAPIGIGTERLFTYEMTGYISNLRILPDISLYNANFTPPSLPLTNTVPGTVTNNTYGIYQNY